MGMVIAEKYRLIARSLREVADSSMEKRVSALSLAARFDQLAREARDEPTREIDALFGRSGFRGTD